MKINQVEQMVGIAKKNIRYYESEGLLSPQRNAVNGYRDYSEEDVKRLKNIKLLRKLSLPIEDIRLVLEGAMALWEALDRHKAYLKQQCLNLNNICALCEEIAGERATLELIETDGYLDKMDKLEKEGVRFMNPQNKDSLRKKMGPLLAAALVITAMCLIIGLLIWAELQDPLPAGFFVLILLLPAAVIVGVLLALRQRLREIKGGEEDAASKY